MVQYPEKPMWAVVNNKTGRVSWTRIGHKGLAIYRTRREARQALFLGETCLDGRVVRLVA